MKRNWKLWNKLVFVLAFTLFINLSAYSQQSTDINKVDLSKYKTFDFRPGISSTRSGKIVHNSELDQKVNCAVAEQLKAKGLTQSSSKPDLVITYTHGIKEVKELQSRAPEYTGPMFITPDGIWAGAWGNWYLRETEKEAFVIDVIDNTTGQWVYRVLGAGDLKKNSRKQQKEINKITKKGFVDFN